MLSSPPTTTSRWRTPAILAWMVLAVSGPVLEVMVPTSTEATDWQWPVGMLVFAPTAAVILVRRPGNRIGLVLAAIATATSVIFNGGWMALQLGTGTASIVIEHLTNVGAVVSFWGLIALLHLFPDGETVGPVWGWAFGIFTAFVLGLVPILTVVSPEPMPVTGLENPFGVDQAWLSTLRDRGLASLPVGAVVGVASLVARFRHSGAIERAQLKVFGLGSVFLLGLVAIIAIVPEDVDPALDAVLRVFVILGFWALPVAITLAILRYRLYDIDRIASRSATYLIVVVLLALGYVATLLLLQSLLPTDGALAVAASTLAMASLLAPLRRAVQRQVDRRFFRRRYDSAALVSHMAGFAGTSVDLDELQRKVTEVLAGALEPESLSLWVRSGVE